MEGLVLCSEVAGRQAHTRDKDRVRVGSRSRWLSDDAKDKVSLVVQNLFVPYSQLLRSLSSQTDNHMSLLQHE